MTHPNPKALVGEVFERIRVGAGYDAAADVVERRVALLHRLMAGATERGDRESAIRIRRRLDEADRIQLSMARDRDAEISAITGKGPKRMTTQRQTDSYAAPRRDGGQEPIDEPEDRFEGWTPGPTGAPVLRKRMPEREPDRFDDEGPTEEDVGDAMADGMAQGFAEGRAKGVEEGYQLAERDIAEYARRCNFPLFALGIQKGFHRPGGAS